MSLESERQRILDEYARRRDEVDHDLYAPWNVAQQMAIDERRRTAARLLHRTDTFPRPGTPCLEIGFGQLGWLADLLGWGLRITDLHGVELNQSRVDAARLAFPGADLRHGDATQLPWEDQTFQLIITSTVFTSVLDPAMRQRLADEIVRTLRPGGAFLFYDFRFNNPKNPNVRKVDRAELRRLFHDLEGPVHSVTLAPPIARRLAPWCPSLVMALSAVPFLKTHLLAVLCAK